MKTHWTAGCPKDTRLRIGRPAQGLPGPSGPEPRKSPKKVPKESPRAGPPESPKSAPRSLKRHFSDSFETPGRTLWGLWGSRSGGLFRDFFRTLSGFRARRARETLCRAGPILTPGRCPCKFALFFVSFSVAINRTSPRQVDPGLSHRVSQGHPAGVRGFS